MRKTYWLTQDQKKQIRHCQIEQIVICSSLHNRIAPDDDAGDYIAKYTSNEDRDVGKGDRQYHFQRQILCTPDQCHVFRLAQIHQFRNILNRHDISIRDFHASASVSNRSIILTAKSYIDRSSIQ